MTDRSASAQQCLVAISAHLTMSTRRDENFQMWVDVAADLMSDCQTCPDGILPMRLAMEHLVAADCNRARDNALFRLRLETQKYFQRAAAHRFEVWNEAVGADAAKTGVPK